MELRKAARRKEVASMGGLENRKKYAPFRQFVIDFCHNIEKNCKRSVASVAAEVQGPLTLFMIDQGAPNIIAKTNRRKKCREWIHDHMKNCKICQGKFGK